MASHRSNRVAEEIKKEIADIIRNEMKDPRVRGLVSVTHVEVSRDISAATVYISTLGEVGEQDGAIKAVRQAGGYIRGELANRLRLRFIPELNFKYDNSIQVGARINALINQTARESQESERQDTDDSISQKGGETEQV